MVADGRRPLYGMEKVPTLLVARKPGREESPRDTNDIGTRHGGSARVPRTMLRAVWGGMITAETVAPPRRIYKRRTAREMKSPGNGQSARVAPPGKKRHPPTMQDSLEGAQLDAPQMPRTPLANFGDRRYYLSDEDRGKGRRLALDKQRRRREALEAVERGDLVPAEKAKGPTPDADACPPMVPLRDPLPPSDKPPPECALPPPNPCHPPPITSPLLEMSLALSRMSARERARLLSEGE